MYILYILKKSTARSNTVNSVLSNNWTRFSDIYIVIIMKYDFNYKYTEGKQI